MSVDGLVAEGDLVAARILELDGCPRPAGGRLEFEAEDAPRSVLQVRYEYREALVRLGVLPAPRTVDSPLARELETVADYLVRRSVWIMGGDGWAYDIGFGGVDHVLAADRDVNLLVLDTEVYSNTGGQMSKATPRGAIAKFAAGGKATAKKDLAMMAMSYGHVYVAQVALGAKDVQTVRAFLEAESYPGPSLILAYSPCLAQGIDLGQALQREELAVRSGHWPLFRYDPRRIAEGKSPLQLDSKRPDIPYEEFARAETRFSALWRNHPEAAERFARIAQEEVEERYQHYEQLAALSVEQAAEHHLLHPATGH
jgi:pyruvate-ferredoxin/flavodoxin oxidoreductase